jgi:DNA-binding response OmpR family regulator
MFLKVLVLGLEAYDFEVVTAIHGDDALAKFHSSTGKFDAVLTDHDMPGMNGLQFVRSLRALGFSGRVVVMSGRLSASDCRAYHDFAVSGFFQKPFEIGLLAEMLLSK